MEMFGPGSSLCWTVQQQTNVTFACRERGTSVTFCFAIIISLKHS